jgi:hypothetical protein
MDCSHSVNLDAVTAALENPCQATIQALLEDNQTVFWVDWRHEDE